MDLSSELISQFVKITNDDKNTKNESTLYGTIVQNGDSKYVRLDGSELLTPITMTTDIEPGERVIVLLKNHTATVTGNLSSPAARTERVEEINNAVAYKVSANEIEALTAIIGELKAKVISASEISAIDMSVVLAKIETLEANVGKFDNLNATEISATNAEINSIKADIATFTTIDADSINAMNADIDNLFATTAKFKCVSTERLNAIDADIENLNTKKLSAESADIKYAKIDFGNIGEAAITKLFSESGIIGDLVVKDGTITGKLVGVTVSGDLIEGNTVKADKLVVLGDDGLYYKLNVNSLGETAVGEMTEDEQTELKNGLHGSTIIAKSITAEKVDVKDLVAFGATIGGFNISNNSLYSGVKSSVNNTTKGIYLDNTGQIAFGDSNNFIKYYKDTDGTYKLAISAGVIELGGGKNVSDVIHEAVDNVEIGGRNLIQVSMIDSARNVETTKIFELKNVWASIFISNENLVKILEPATEYTIKYNVKLTERTERLSI